MELWSVCIAVAKVQNILRLLGEPGFLFLSLFPALAICRSYQLQGQSMCSQKMQVCRSIHTAHLHAWIHRSTQSIHCLCCHLQHLEEQENHSPGPLLVSKLAVLYLQSPQTLAINPHRTVALIIGLPISSLVFGVFTPVSGLFQLASCCSLIEVLISHTS